MIQRDISFMFGGYSEADIEREKNDGGNVGPEDLDAPVNAGLVILPTAQVSITLRRGTIAEDEKSLRSYVRKTIRDLEKRHEGLTWMLDGMFVNEFVNLNENFTY